jgi:hypothetical protein
MTIIIHIRKRSSSANTGLGLDHRSYTRRKFVTNNASHGPCSLPNNSLRHQFSESASSHESIHHQRTMTCNIGSFGGKTWRVEESPVGPLVIPRGANLYRVSGTRWRTIGCSVLTAVSGSLMICAVGTGMYEKCDLQWDMMIAREIEDNHFLKKID